MSENRVFDVLIETIYTHFHYFVVAQEDREAVSFAEEQHAKTPFAQCKINNITLKAIDLSTKGILGSEMAIVPRSQDAPVS